MPDYANQACGPASPRPIPLVAVARNGRGLVSISFFFGLWGGGAITVLLYVILFEFVTR